MKIRKHYVDKPEISQVDYAQKRQFMDFNAQNMYYFR